MTTNGEIMPSDILRTVFELYALEVSDQYPLETLLSVCRHWKEVVLGCRILWGRITAIIGHRHTFAIAEAHVKSRLYRSGPTAPLSISIFKNIDHSARLDQVCLENTNSNKCCKLDAFRLVMKLLDQLAGVNGHLCTRWRSLRISCGDYRDNFYSFEERQELPSMKVLTYPMPSLTSLRLERFSADEARLFPSTPSLSSLHLSNSISHALFDIRNLRKLIYRGEPPVVPIYLGDLNGSIYLKKMQIFMPHINLVMLPKYLPALEYLSITSFQSSLAYLTAPKLKEFSISLTAHDGINGFVSSTDFVFNSITKLRFSFRWSRRQAESEGKVLAIISKMTSLMSATFDTHTTKVILKAVWNSMKCEDGSISYPLPPHPVEIYAKSYINHPICVLTGDESPEQIEKVAREHSLMWEDPTDGS